MYVCPPKPPLHVTDLTRVESCQDQVTAQPPPARWPEAGVAAVRQAVVRGLHHAYNRELSEGRHPYVYAPTAQLAPRAHLTRSIGFVAFDQYKKLLVDENGKLSGPRTVIAGFGAGVTESLLAVTPFESIKTTLYVPPAGPPPAIP